MFVKGELPILPKLFLFLDIAFSGSVAFIFLALGGSQGVLISVELLSRPLHYRYKYA